MYRQWPRLPNEVWSIIVRKLELNELLALRATSHYMYDMVMREAIQFEFLKWGRQLMHRGKDPNWDSLWYIVRHGDATLLDWAVQHYPSILTTVSLKSKTRIITYVCEQEYRKLDYLIPLGCISQLDLLQIFPPHGLPNGYSRLLCTEDPEQLEWVLQRIGYPEGELRDAATCALLQAIQLKLSVSTLKRLVQRLAISAQEAVHADYECCFLHDYEFTYKYRGVIRAAVYNDNTAALLFFCEYYDLWKGSSAIVGGLCLLYLLLFEKKSTMLTECLTQAMTLLETDDKTVLYGFLTHAATELIVNTDSRHTLSTYADGLIHLRNHLSLSPPSNKTDILNVGISNYFTSEGSVDIVKFWRQLLQHDIVTESEVMEAVQAEQLMLRDPLLFSILIERTKQLFQDGLGLKERVGRSIKLYGLCIARSYIDFRSVINFLLKLLLAFVVTSVLCYGSWKEVLTYLSAVLFSWKEVLSYLPAMLYILRYAPARRDPRRFNSVLLCIILFMQLTCIPLCRVYFGELIGYVLIFASVIFTTLLSFYG